MWPCTQRQYHIQIIKCHTSRRKQKQNTKHVLEGNQPANQIKKDKEHLPSEKKVKKLYHQFKSFFVFSSSKKLQFFNASFRVLSLHIKITSNRCLLIFLLLLNAMSES